MPSLRVQPQAVELVDELLAVHQVVLRFPRVLLASVALPSDQVLPLALLVPPLVHYPLHLKWAETNTYLMCVFYTAIPLET